MKKLMALAVIGIFILGGCFYIKLAKPPTLAELEAADCGVAPENPKEQALARLKVILPDPMSAVIEWEGECEKAWWGWPPNSFAYHAYGSKPEAQKIFFGWAISANINAKNLLGGYVGFRIYTFCFRDGKLDKVFTP